MILLGHIKSSSPVGDLGMVHSLWHRWLLFSGDVPLLQRLNETIRPRHWAACCSRCFLCVQATSGLPRTSDFKYKIGWFSIKKRFLGIKTCQRPDLWLVVLQHLDALDLLGTRATTIYQSPDPFHSRLQIFKPPHGQHSESTHQGFVPPHGSRGAGCEFDTSNCSSVPAGGSCEARWDRGMEG